MVVEIPQEHKLSLDEKSGDEWFHNSLNVLNMTELHT